MNKQDKKGKDVIKRTKKGRFVKGYCPNPGGRKKRVQRKLTPEEIYLKNVPPMFRNIDVPDVPEGIKYIGEL